jgi:hypothetical protein
LGVCQGGVKTAHLLRGQPDHPAVVLFHLARQPRTAFEGHTHHMSPEAVVDGRSLWLIQIKKKRHNLINNIRFFDED